MESFYGGRQGASFILVKRFDGINIPLPGDPDYKLGANYHTFGEYAVDSTNAWILETNASLPGATPVTDGTSIKYLIARNKENYTLYSWKKQANNGEEIDSTGFAFPIKVAEGMVQCFRKGALSANEVNYNEYVIIDTMLNMHMQNDPDNGKVFRRGLFFDNGLEGAEYVGQIVGPQGEVSELDFDTYDEVIKKAEDPRQIREYNPVNGGIIPGATKIADDNFSYVDEIKYAWATIRDEFGNVTGCEIGFKLPTLVQDYIGTSISPYDNRVSGTGFDSKYSNLISEDPREFDVATGKWNHPFFQQWQVKIPQGYHGINPEDIEIIHTYTMTPQHKRDANGNPGVIEIYDDAECTSVYKTITESSAVQTYRIYGTEYEYVDSNSKYKDDPDYDKIQGKYYMENGADYDADPSVISVMIAIDGGYKYVKKEDCYMDIVRYKEIDFDKVRAGDARYFYIGEYNNIQRITISDTGILTAFYSARPQPQELEQVLRWIDTKDTDGITIDDDGTVHVYYNTVHDETDPDTGVVTTVHDHQDYPNVLDWITEAKLTADGKFTILYNNDTVKIGEDPITGDPIYGNKYETTLQWVDFVDFNYDGTVTFRWNTDVSRTGTPAYQFNNVIKFIAEDQTDPITGQPIRGIDIENVKPYDNWEGTGDQKVHVRYNNDGGIDHPIGMPLNYPIEYAVVKNKNEGYPKYTADATKNIESLNGHLLVYYSDPELRKTLGKYVSATDNQWITYPSEKYMDPPYIDPVTGATVQKAHVWTEWIDLGNIAGEPGGIHVLKEVKDMSELKDAAGNWVPPERLEDTAPGHSGLILGDIAAGWCCTLEVLKYILTNPATDPKALKIVADGTPLGPNEIHFSTVDAITPGFNVGDYVRETKDSEYLFYDYEKKLWYPKKYNMDSGAGLANPKSVIDKSVPIYDTDKGWIPDEKVAGDAKDLEINGWWFASDIGVFVE